MDSQNVFHSVLESLSPNLKDLLYSIPDEYKNSIEEIRLRNGYPLSIYCNNRDYFISKYGVVLTGNRDGYIINKAEIDSCFQIITNYSVYAFTEEIRNGFITIKGGHRVGIGGKIIYNNGGIDNIKNISSLNIRIGREKKNISNKIIPYLLSADEYFLNTLIISPPQCGKTTLIRDIIRNLSNGHGIKNNRGFKISLVDERSEIAGMYNGLPTKDLGCRTDILDGCLKSDGIMILIRAMSPEIIAVDEIGGKGDIEAIGEGLRAGIGFIATIHGHSLEDIKNRVNMKELFNEKIFKRYILLDRSNGVGTISEIINGEDGKILYSEKRNIYVRS